MPATMMRTFFVITLFSAADHEHRESIRENGFILLIHFRAIQVDLHPFTLFDLPATEKGWHSGRFNFSDFDPFQKVPESVGMSARPGLLR